MNIEKAIQAEIDSLSEKLGQFVQAAYEANDFAGARSEAERHLAITLSQFKAMFGFPDSFGMNAMAQAVELVACFMLKAEDERGAKELLNRPWAFGAGLPNLSELRSNTNG